MAEITPLVIIQLLTAFFEALAGFFKWAITPTGQRAINLAIDDEVARRKALERAGQWLHDLFTGKLFENASNHQTTTA